MCTFIVPETEDIDLRWKEKKQTNMVSKKTVSGLKLIKAQVCVVGGVGGRSILGGD